MIECPSLVSASLSLQCSLNGEDLLQCEKPFVPGTRVSVSCKNSYKRDNDIEQKDVLTCQINGEWNYKPIKCIPGSQTNLNLDNPQQIVIDEMFLVLNKFKKDLIKLFNSINDFKVQEKLLKLIVSINITINKLKELYKM